MNHWFDSILEFVNSPVHSASWSIEQRWLLRVTSEDGVIIDPRKRQPATIHGVEYDLREGNIFRLLPAVREYLEMFPHGVLVRTRQCFDPRDTNLQITGKKGKYFVTWLREQPAPWPSNRPYEFGIKGPIPIEVLGRRHFFIAKEKETDFVVAVKT